MSGTAYLIGGGELRDKNILSRAPKVATLVLLEFAAQDSADG